MRSKSGQYHTPTPHSHYYIQTHSLMLSLSLSLDFTDGSYGCCDMSSPGIMLLIYDLINGASHLKLQIMDIETGNVLNTLKHTLFPVAKIEILEQFNSKLLIKQTGHPLQIVDVTDPSPPIISLPSLSLTHTHTHTSPQPSLSLYIYIYCIYSHRHPTSP